MPFDKAKVIKAAEKFLSQGKISAAIKEYRLLVENDDTDLTALNMLGDLCVRAEKTDEAITCFQRIAEHYADQEFTLKAIAMYKKIDRLKPKDPYIAHKLGNLYATQGLIVDARAQFLVVADAYTRAGQTKKALDVFHRIADLDPLNTEIRLKLAEGYVKEGLTVEAAEAFVDAGRHFLDSGAFDKSLDSYSKALKLQPDRNSIYTGVLAAHVGLGTADEAVELLQRAIEEHPENLDLVQTLVNACLEAEDPKAAEEAVAKLPAQDATDYTRRVPIARIYLKLGQVDETSRVLTGIVEQMLAGRDEKELLEIVNEVLVRNPEQVEALRLLVRIHWWQRDMEALQTALERLAEAAEAAGLVDDERYALTQLVRLVPDEQKFGERLNKIGGASEEASAEPMIQAESFAEAQFETFSTTGNEVPGVEQKDQFEWEVVASESHHDPSASFADLSDNFERPATAIESEFETNQAGDSGFNISLDAPAVEPAAPAEDQARREAMMRQELESVDFYLAQGYNDIAADTLEMLERQFGSHPDIQSRREVLSGAAAPVDSRSDVFEFGGVQDFSTGGGEVAATEVLPEREPVFGEVSLSEPAEIQRVVVPSNTPAAPPAGPGLDAGLAEIFEEFRMAAEEEQPHAHEDYETHYNMGTAYKEMDLLDDAIHEFQTAAGLVQAGDGTSRFLQCCHLLGHCFLQKEMPRAAAIWFQKALDAGGHSDEERKALRYELASAFEQMGEVNRALDLYTEVYGIDVGYRQVGDKIRTLGGEKYSDKGKKKQ